MVVPEAARPPAESRDSPYAPSKSTKGKNTSVSSIASMKLLMRGVSPKDIFSRAPSRASSQIGLDRTSGAQGSGSSTLETIDQGASESDAETAARHVARLTKSEEERAKSIEVLLAKRDAGEAPSADEPSSAELRKELVGLEAKRAAASASVGAGAAVARLTKSEEERAKSIEVLLAKRDAGEAPSADEPSSAELRKELCGRRRRSSDSGARGEAPSRGGIGGAGGARGRRRRRRRSSDEVGGGAGEVHRGASREARRGRGALGGRAVERGAAQGAGGARAAAASASVGAAVARLTTSEEERAKSIEVLLAKRDAGEAPSADEPSSAELRKELVGLEAKRAAASASVGAAVARLTKSEEERAKSIEVLLAKRDAGEAPSADEPSSAELRKELVGLEAKRAAASASVGAAVARLTKSEEERAKSIEVLLAKRDAGEAPSADEPSSAELRKELVGLEAKRAAASASVGAAVARLTKSEEERAKSIEVLLAKRDAGEAPSADEPSSAELRKELVGLEAKRAAASASVGAGAAVARLTKSEEERAKSIEVLLAKRDAGEAPSADEPSSAELRKELVGPARGGGRGRLRPAAEPPPRRPERPRGFAGAQRCLRGCVGRAVCRLG